jgi:hypothetical protein
MPDPAVRCLVDLFVHTKECEYCLLGQGCHRLSLAELRRVALGLAGVAAVSRRVERQEHVAKVETLRQGAAGL